jgi:ribose-phosphate pyrophosphokinase
MIVLGFPENIAQSTALAAALGCAHASIDIHRFPDGESRLTLPPLLPARVILFRSLHDPNAKLTELLIAAGGARALGAVQLALVAPYLCYMRQDKAFVPGQPVSQRIIGTLLAQQFDAVFTIDPHLHRVATLTEAVPARLPVCLTAAGLLGDFLCRELPPDALLIGPDEESAQWVERVAGPGGFASAVARKERFGDASVKVTLPAVDVTGRHTVLVDDVISSGHTMMEAAGALRARGAASVSAIATHGLFAPGALAGMRASGIRRVWVTDAIPAQAGDETDTTLPTADLIASSVRSSGF